MSYYRPSEVPALIGHASKAAMKLGWVSSTSLEAIVEEMSDISSSKGRSAIVLNPATASRL
jgi:GDP-D-mannose dehydratase